MTSFEDKLVIVSFALGSIITMTMLCLSVWYQCGGYWTLRGIWARLVEKIKTGKGKIL